MPPLPDRSGRALPDTADVVVVGGGYAGINAARELARRGTAVTLVEANTLGFGASTRNGGIVHPGYKWARASSIRRYGEDTGRALYRDTLDGYETVKRLIAEHSIDCSFREVRDLELAYAPSHMRDLQQQRESLAAVGVPTIVIPREKLRTEIGSDAYFGALVVPDGGAHPSGKLLRRARRGRRSGRRRPARGRPRATDPPPGGRPLRRRDRARRDPGARRAGHDQRLHRRRRPVAATAGDPDRELHHRQRAVAGGARPRHLAQRPGVLRHEELPVLLAHLGRPPDGLRRSRQLHADVGRADRGDPPPRPAAGPSADGRPPDRLRVGRQRRVHVRPDAARRPDRRRRRLRDGLLRDRRRADDAPRHGDGGVAGGRRGAGADEARSSRSCRRRTRAGRGSCRWSGNGTGSRTGWRPGRRPR